MTIHAASIRGSGKPTVVVHGGPGLDHQYLLKHLQPLEGERKLIYYDQLGCGANAAQSADICSVDDDLKLLLAIINQSAEHSTVSLVAHSWGCYLALLAALETTAVDELVLISPFAIYAEAFANTGARLASRFPNDVLVEYEALSKEKYVAGSDLMNLIIPYYLHDSTNKTLITVPFFSAAINERILSSLGSFDLRPRLRHLSLKPYLIFGETDFIRPEDHRELIAVSENIKIVESSGHFPFAENPAAFLTSMPRIRTS